MLRAAKVTTDFVFRSTLSGLLRRFVHLGELSYFSYFYKLATTHELNLIYPFDRPEYLPNGLPA